jgi:hypothetical protein
MRRALVAVAVGLTFAVVYLAGLVATGDALFRLELTLPAGPGSPLVRTAQYWAAGASSLQPAPAAAASSAASASPVGPPPSSALAGLIEEAPAAVVAAQAASTLAVTGSLPACAHPVCPLKGRQPVK